MKINALPEKCNWKIFDKDLVNKLGIDYLTELETDNNWIKSIYTNKKGEPVYIHKITGYIKIREYLITKGSKRFGNYRDENKNLIPESLEQYHRLYTNH